MSAVPEVEPGAPRSTFTGAQESAESLLCPLCWSRPRRPCTITGPPGDHLARWLEAEHKGLVTRDQLADVIRTLIVIATHVILSDGAP